MRKFKGKKVIYEDEAILICLLQEDSAFRKLVIIGTGNIIDWRPMSIQEPLFYGCTVVAMYFKTRYKGLIKSYRMQDRGLGPSGKSLAEFIDTSDFVKQYKYIFLAMYSKCGVMSVTSVVNYLKRKGICIFSISAPYLGTPSVMLAKIKRRIFQREESFGKRIVHELEYLAYRVTFGDYLVDHDISLNSSYFRDNFKEESLKGHMICNIVSDCEIETDEDEKELIDHFLCWLDTRLKIKGDGVVPLYSQEYLYNQNVCDESYLLNTTHATSLAKARPIIQRYINHVY